MTYLRRHESVVMHQRCWFKLEQREILDLCAVWYTKSIVERKTCDLLINLKIVSAHKTE